jgi:hypothetical protein
VYQSEALEERSRQALLVRIIFAIPMRVIIWLGEDNGSAAKAVRILQRADEYCHLELGQKLQDDVTAGELKDISVEELGFFAPNTDTRDLLPL